MKIKKIQNPPALWAHSFEKRGLKNGFTLFELLVSISIIGILTALASVAFSGAQKKARDARRVEDMKLIQVAAEQYYSQSAYVYPSTTAPANWIPTGGQAVLNMFPVDPKNDATNGYVYSYTTTGVGTTGYCACSKIENVSNGNSIGACNFTTAGNKNYFCVKNQQ